MFPFDDEYDLDEDELAMHAGALASVARELQARQARESRARVNPFAKYRDDPIGFFREVLGVEPWESADPKQSGQADLIRAIRDHDKVATKSGQKTSKALALDTRVPTPSGWSTMGELQTGDEVFDEQGRVCRVIDTTEIMHGHDCYEVEFDDGTCVIADAGHQWFTWSHAARKAAGRAARPRTGPSVVTTEQIARSVDTPHSGKNHAVMNAKPFVGSNVGLVIDPYVLGFWLADGNNSGGGVTIGTRDMDIAERVVANGYEFGVMREKGGATRATILGLHPKLRMLNLLHNKHVPPAYLRACEADRRSLLAGLLDGDGTCDPRGGIMFTSKDRPLADAVFELAAGLGFKPHRGERRAMLYGVDHGPSYQVNFVAHEPVFRTPFKLERQPLQRRRRHQAVHQRAIYAVRPVPSAPVRCISVDSPSRLFLVTDAFIPTHNSNSAVGIALWWAASRSDARVVITAPSFTQVKDVLWKEVLRLNRPRVEGSLDANGDVIGAPYRDTLEKLLGVFIPLDPATGIKFPNTGNDIVGKATNTPERMAGTSSPNLLYIIDEGSGYPDDIYEAVLGNLTGGGKLFVISNPTKTSGWFFNLFMDRPAGWKLFTLNSENTPNVRAGKRVIPGVAERKTIEEWRAKAGPDYINNPFYMVRVLGMFPPQGSNSVISMTVLERAMNAWSAESSAREIADLVIGVDVARQGDDTTVMQAVRGYHAYEPRSIPKELSEGANMAGQIVQYARELRVNDEFVRVNIDSSGLGWSPTDALRRTKAAYEGWLQVSALVVGEVADSEDQHVNLRTQLWFGCAEWLKEGGRLPKSDRLMKEMLAATYTFDARGRLKVEPKDLMKLSLGGRSPDFADALCMATYRGPRGGMIKGELYTAAPDPRHGGALIPDDSDVGGGHYGGLLG